MKIVYSKYDFSYNFEKKICVLKKRFYILNKIVVMWHCAHKNRVKWKIPGKLQSPPHNSATTPLHFVH